MSSDKVKQEDAVRARKLIESIFQNRGWTNDQLTTAITDLLATVRRETWQAAIKVARESTKKSQAAKLNIAAAEILIRRLEMAAPAEASANTGSKNNGT